MAALQIQVLAQHTLWPTSATILEPLAKLPLELEMSGFQELAKFYVGFVRAGRQKRDAPAILKHHPAWAWLEVTSARQAMAERRARGTSVLLVEAWLPVRRAGQAVFLGPAEHPFMSGWCWMVDAQTVRLHELPCVSRDAQVPTVLWRLYDTNTNKYRYRPDDPKAWTAVDIAKLLPSEAPRAGVPLIERTGPADTATKELPGLQ